MDGSGLSIVGEAGQKPLKHVTHILLRRKEAENIFYVSVRPFAMSLSKAP